MSKGTAGIWFAVVAFSLLNLNGCAFNVPTSSYEDIIGDTPLDSLVGRKKSEIHQQLGEPGQELFDGKKSYFIYSGFGSNLGVVLVVYLPIPVPAPDVLHCVLLEFDSADILTTFDSGYIDRNGLGYCPSLFWSKEELQVIERTTREVRKKLEVERENALRRRAGEGDRDAAIEVAHRYDEPSYLRIVAEGGDVVAAIELAQRFDEPEPLRVLARQGNNLAVTTLTEMEAEKAFDRYESVAAEKGPKTEALRWSVTQPMRDTPWHKRR